MEAPGFVTQSCLPLPLPGKFLIISHDPHLSLSSLRIQDDILASLGLGWEAETNILSVTLARVLSVISFSKDTPNQRESHPIPTLDLYISLPLNSPASWIQRFLPFLCNWKDDWLLLHWKTSPLPGPTPSVNLATTFSSLIILFMGFSRQRILKWFAIPFSGRPHSVRRLHHDPAVLGGPTRHGLVSLS